VPEEGEIMAIPARNRLTRNILAAGADFRIPSGRTDSPHADNKDVLLSFIAVPSLNYLIDADMS
jgi:hypothetical protein